jgi:hypothetical protein
MRKEDLPDSLRARIEAAEVNLSRRIVLRGARWPDCALRGRVTHRTGLIVLEYRDDIAGYFWHYDIIGELLDHVEKGHFEVTLLDQQQQSIENPPRFGFEK